VNALSIDNKNKFLFSWSSDKKILVWDYEKDFRLVERITEHEDAITSLISFDNIKASASLDKTIKIWYFSFKQLNEKKLAHDDTMWKICVLENGLIATGWWDKTIKIWNKNNESSLELVTSLTEHTGEVFIFINYKFIIIYIFKP